MPRCVIVGCNENGRHTFPNDPKLKKLWEKATKIKKFKASKYSRLCSKHFKESDYQEICATTGLPPLCRHLKKGVVPSIFPWTPKPSTSAIERQNRYMERFPVNERLQKKWTEVTGRHDWKPTKYSKICSLHFERTDFQIKKQNVILKRNSIQKKDMQISKTTPIIHKEIEEVTNVEHIKQELEIDEDLEENPVTENCRVTFEKDSNDFSRNDNKEHRPTEEIDIKSEPLEVQSSSESSEADEESESTLSVESQTEDGLDEENDLSPSHPTASKISSSPKCGKCNQIVPSLVMHLCKNEIELPTNKKCYICIVCTIEFHGINMFREHALKHGGRLQKTEAKYYFPTQNEFMTWKNHMEKQTHTDYSLIEVYEGKKYYYCKYNNSILKQKVITLCPSMVIAQEFQNGVLVKYYHIHQYHLFEDYKLAPDYANYNIDHLTKPILNYPVIKTYDEHNPYQHFKVITENVVIQAGKIDDTKLKLLMGKVLEMTSILAKNNDVDAILLQSIAKQQTQNIAKTDPVHQKPVIYLKAGESLIIPSQKTKSPMIAKAVPLSKRNRIDEDSKTSNKNEISHQNGTNTKSVNAINKTIEKGNFNKLEPLKKNGTEEKDSKARKEASNLIVNSCSKADDKTNKHLNTTTKRKNTTTIVNKDGISNKNIFTENIVKKMRPRILRRNNNKIIITTNKTAEEADKDNEKLRPNEDSIEKEEELMEVERYLHEQSEIKEELNEEDEMEEDLNEENDEEDHLNEADEVLSEEYYEEDYLDEVNEENYEEDHLDEVNEEGDHLNEENEVEYNLNEKTGQQISGPGFEFELIEQTSDCNILVLKMI